MNRHYQETDFSKLRVPQLENIYNGIDHQVEELQIKMAADMNRSAYLDILPRNYNIIPEINECSLHDIKSLEDLTSKRFTVHWLIEKMKAEKNGTLEKYYAEYKFYSIRNGMNDEQINELFNLVDAYCNQRMTSHKIIQCIMKYPNFLEEVMCV